MNSLRQKADQTSMILLLLRFETRASASKATGRANRGQTSDFVFPVKIREGVSKMSE